MTSWALISGEKGQGKAEFVLEVARRLGERGLKVAGFVQQGLEDAQTEQKRYELHRLATGERAVLAVEGIAAKGPTQELFCTYAFKNEIFEVARGWVEADAPGADVVIVSEVSKLEIAGKGHAAALRHALGLEGPRVVVVSARASQLFYVVENFGLGADPVAAVELPADGAQREGLVSEIAAALGR